MTVSSSKKLFKTFEIMMEGFVAFKSKNSFPSAPMLMTNFDDPVLDKANAKKVNFIKRQVGRLKKWMADISLQVGSLGEYLLRMHVQARTLPAPFSTSGDAMELFVGAITDLRAVSDGIWLAGALEGLASAILIVLKQGQSIEDYLGKEISLSAQVCKIHTDTHLPRIFLKMYNVSFALSRRCLRSLSR